MSKARSPRRRLLDDHGNHWAHAVSPCCLGSISSSLPGPSPCSGVQSLSRAAASSTGIRFTSATIRSRASGGGDPRGLDPNGRLAQLANDLVDVVLSSSACSRRCSRSPRRDTLGPSAPRRRRARARARRESAASRASCSRELLRRLAGDGSRSRGDAAASRAVGKKPCEQLVRRARRRAGRSGSTSDAWTSVSTAASRKRMSISVLHLLAQPALDVAAQLGERVELARSARQVVVDRRQHLLLHVVQHDLDARGRLVGQLVARPTSSRRRHAAERAPRSPRRAVRAELDDDVAARLARGSDDVDHDDVALTGRPAVDRRRARRPSRAAPRSPLDQLLRHLRRRRAAPRARPVRQLGRRLDRDGRREVGRRRPTRAGRSRSRAARSDGCAPSSAALRNQPPMWLVIASSIRAAHGRSGSRAPASAPCPCGNRGPSPMPQDPGCVVDGVLEVVPRNRDGEADLVLGELLDGRVHRAIEPEPLS